MLEHKGFQSTEITIERKEGRKEGRKGGREEGRKEGRKEGREKGRKEEREEVDCYCVRIKTFNHNYISLFS